MTNNLEVQNEKITVSARISKEQYDAITSLGIPMSRVISAGIDHFLSLKNEDEKKLWLIEHNSDLKNILEEVGKEIALKALIPFPLTIVGSIAGGIVAGVLKSFIKESKK